MMTSAATEGGAFKDWSARGAAYRANVRRERMSNDWMTGYTVNPIPWEPIRVIGTSASRIQSNASLYSPRPSNVFLSKSMSGNAAGSRSCGGGMSVSKPDSLTSLRVLPYHGAPVDRYKFNAQWLDNDVIGGTSRSTRRFFAQTGIVAENRNRLCGTDTYAWFRPAEGCVNEYLHTAKKYPIPLMSCYNHLYCQIQAGCPGDTEPPQTLKEHSVEASDNKQKNSVGDELRFNPFEEKRNKMAALAVKLQSAVSCDWLTNDPYRTDDPTINFLRDKCSFNHSPIMERKPAAETGGFMIDEKANERDVPPPTTTCISQKCKEAKLDDRRAELEERKAEPMERRAEPAERQAEPMEKKADHVKKEAEKAEFEDSLSVRSQKIHDAIAANRKLMDEFLADCQGIDSRKQRQQTDTTLAGDCGYSEHRPPVDAQTAVILEEDARYKKRPIAYSLMVNCDGSDLNCQQLPPTDSPSQTDALTMESCSIVDFPMESPSEISYLTLEDDDADLMRMSSLRGTTLRAIQLPREETITEKIRRITAGLSLTGKPMEATKPAAGRKLNVSPLTKFYGGLKRKNKLPVHNRQWLN